jgi:hypothetical protein
MRLLMKDPGPLPRMLIFPDSAKGQVIRARGLVRTIGKERRDMPFAKWVTQHRVQRYYYLHTSDKQYELEGVTFSDPRLAATLYIAKYICCGGAPFSLPTSPL